MCSFVIHITNACSALQNNGILAREKKAKMFSENKSSVKNNNIHNAKAYIPVVEKKLKNRKKSLEISTSLKLVLQVSICNKVIGPTRN